MMPRCPLLIVFVVICAQAADVPKFDVASIKLCDVREGPAPRGGRSVSPGRLSQGCTTVSNLIRQAYIEFANGQEHFLSSTPVEGGPAWITSALYRIDATTRSGASAAMMKGPMLQALLEDRFGLRITRKTREVSVYFLTVSKGGAKLRATGVGSCVPVDTALPAPYPQFCGVAKRGEPGIHLIGATMTDLCRVLSAPELSDRPTIDRTGISGMFDIPLPGPAELRRNSSAAGGDSPDLFEGLRAAMDALGLTLKPGKGPGEFLTIDRIDRPSEN
jgi:uncharacterized protein (TIGR03435 family)